MVDEVENGDGSVGGGTEPSGSDSFDMESAMGEISEGLGFESPEKLEVAEPAESAAELTTAEPAATEPAETSPAADFPRTWKPELQAKWGQLDPDVRAEIARREEDIFKGIESYKAGAEVGKSFQTAIAPYLPLLQSHGIDPIRQTAALMQAHYTLAMGTVEQKQQMFAKLARDYGLMQEAENEFVAPEVKQLREELTGVKSHLQQQAERQAQEHQARLAAEINAFAADPANIYFNEVADDIAQLLRSGAAPDLKTAYEKAVWLNPVTRGKELAKQTAEAAAKTAQTATAHAQAAKKATAANVSSKPKGVSAATPLGSMDDTMAEVLRNIKARDK